MVAASSLNKKQNAILVSMKKNKFAVCILNCLYCTSVVSCRQYVFFWWTVRVTLPSIAACKAGLLSSVTAHCLAPHLGDAPS